MSASPYPTTARFMKIAAITSPLMERYSQTDLAEVGVRCRRAHGRPVPEGRQADVRANANVPTNAEQYTSACFGNLTHALNIKTDRPDPDAAVDEKSRCDHRIEANSKIERANTEEIAVDRPRPTSSADAK